MLNSLKAVILVVFIMLAASCNVRKIAMRMNAQYLPNAPYDAIIVPGIAYDTARQQYNGFNARIIWAKMLYERGAAKNIIFSGAACTNPYCEGQVMKMIAEKMGVPPEHVFSENRAEHGKENVYYSYLMGKRLGFKKMALAADPYQAFFLEGFIQANIPDMGIMPIAVDSLKKLYLPVPKIDATPALVKDFIPLKKREKFWTRVKHTNHNNLPTLPEGYVP